MFTLVAGFLAWEKIVWRIDSWRNRRIELDASVRVASDDRLSAAAEASLWWGCRHSGDVVRNKDVNFVWGLRIVTWPLWAGLLEQIAIVIVCGCGKREMRYTGDLWCFGGVSRRVTEICGDVLTSDSCEER